MKVHQLSSFCDLQAVVAARLARFRLGLTALELEAHEVVQKYSIVVRIRLLHSKGMHNHHSP